MRHVKVTLLNFIIKLVMIVEVTVKIKVPCFITRHHECVVYSVPAQG